MRRAAVEEDSLASSSGGPTVTAGLMLAGQRGGDTVLDLLVMGLPPNHVPDGDADHGRPHRGARPVARAVTIRRTAASGCHRGDQRAEEGLAVGQHQAAFGGALVYRAAAQARRKQAGVASEVLGRPADGVDEEAAEVKRHERPVVSEVPRLGTAGWVDDQDVPGSGRGDRAEVDDGLGIGRRFIVSATHAGAWAITAIQICPAP